MQLFNFVLEAAGLSCSVLGNQAVAQGAIFCAENPSAEEQIIMYIFHAALCQDTQIHTAAPHTPTPTPIHIHA